MKNARPLLRMALVVAIALTSALGACAPETSQAQLIYKVTSLDGGPPSEDDMMRARSRLDVRLGEAGYDRRDVSTLAPDRLRVVLPERVADRMAEIREILEKPEGLPVRLSAVGE